MRRVFAVDVLECPRCGGSMRILAAIHPPDAAAAILASLRMSQRPPPVAAPRREPSCGAGAVWRANTEKKSRHNGRLFSICDWFGYVPLGPARKTKREACASDVCFASEVLRYCKATNEAIEAGFLNIEVAKIKVRSIHQDRPIDGSVNRPIGEHRMQIGSIEAKIAVRRAADGVALVVLDERSKISVCPTGTLSGGWTHPGADTCGALVVTCRWISIIAGRPVSEVGVYTRTVIAVAGADLALRIGRCARHRIFYASIRLQVAGRLVTQVLAAIGIIHTAIDDRGPATHPRSVARVGTCTRRAIVAECTRVRSVYAPGDGVARIDGALVGVIAVDQLWDSRTAILFAVPRVVDRARVPVVAERRARGVARSGEVAMSEMGGQRILADRDGVEMVRIAGRHVAYLHLGARSDGRRADCDENGRGQREGTPSGTHSHQLFPPAALDWPRLRRSSSESATQDFVTVMALPLVRVSGFAARNR